MSSLDSTYSFDAEAWLLEHGSRARRAAVSVARRVLGKGASHELIQAYADDIVQELMERAWAREDERFEHPAFVTRAAQNAMLDHLRRLRRRAPLEAPAERREDDESQDSEGSRLLARQVARPLLSRSAEDVFLSKSAWMTAQQLITAFRENAFEQLLWRSRGDRRLTRQMMSEARCAVVKALIARPDMIRLLRTTGRDTYKGAVEEAECLALETGLDIRSVRNVRTAMIKVLRMLLAPDVQLLEAHLRDCLAA